jgi:hypothetical protein
LTLGVHLLTIGTSGPVVDLTVQLIPLTAAFNMNAYLKAAVFKCAAAVNIDLIKGTFFLKSNVQFGKGFQANVEVDAKVGQSLQTAQCVLVGHLFFSFSGHLLSRIHMP